MLAEVKRKMERVVETFNCDYQHRPCYQIWRDYSNHVISLFFFKSFPPSSLYMLGITNEGCSDKHPILKPLRDLSMSKNWPQSLGLIRTTLEGKVFSNVRSVSRIWFPDQTLDNDWAREKSSYKVLWLGRKHQSMLCPVLSGTFGSVLFFSSQICEEPRDLPQLTIKRKLLVRVRICQGQGIKRVLWIWESLL